MIPPHLRTILVNKSNKSNKLNKQSDSSPKLLLTEKLENILKEEDFP